MPHYILKWHILKCILYILKIKFNKFSWEYYAWKRKYHSSELIHFTKHNFKTHPTPPPPLIHELHWNFNLLRDFAISMMELCKLNKPMNLIPNINSIECLIVDPQFRILTISIYKTNS